VNKKSLAGAETKLKQIKAILERAEGYLRAQDYCSIAANVQGSSQEAVAALVLERPDLSGIEGPTIAPVYSAEGGDWYSVTVLVEKIRVLDAVEHMRQFGGSGITVTQPSYLFFDTCLAYQCLTAAVAGIN
jgi:ATP phosphoribosyltransferase